MGNISKRASGATDASDILNALLGSPLIASAQIADVIGKAGNLDFSTASPFSGAPNAMATGGAVVSIVTGGIRWVAERSEGFQTTTNPLIQKLLECIQGSKSSNQGILDEVLSNLSAREKSVLQAAAAKPSHSTREYLRARSNKNLAGTVTSGVGAAAAPATQVNVPGLVKNVSSLTTTSIHIHRLKHFRNHMQKGSHARVILKHILKEKAVKVGARSGAVAADGIPAAVPAAGAIVGSTAALTTTFLKMASSQRCADTAAVLHFLGWYHLIFADSTASWKPGLGTYNADGHQAIMILRELLTQRGVSALAKYTPGHKLGKELHGRAKTVDYMVEPAGWMVINDKLTAL
jgi:hypothetical protein